MELLYILNLSSILWCKINIMAEIALVVDSKYQVTNKNLYTYVTSLLISALLVELCESSDFSFCVLLGKKLSDTKTGITTNIYNTKTDETFDVYYKECWKLLQVNYCFSTFRSIKFSAMQPECDNNWFWMPSTVIPMSWGEIRCCNKLPLRVLPVFWGPLATWSSTEGDGHGTCPILLWARGIKRDHESVFAESEFI